MKRILGLDLGTNSIGWSLIQHKFDKKEGEIDGLGVRIIPMSADILGKFDSGQSHSQTAERTNYRGVRRLYQRDNLRRERLHRVLYILGFLPQHYANSLDFVKKLGQFNGGKEIKLNYRENDQGKHEFVFMEAFQEMAQEFKAAQPSLFYVKQNGEETKIPYDWTIYYLRKKALSKALRPEEFAWLILNFNQKRGYYQLRGEDVETDKNIEFVVLRVASLIDTGQQVKGNPLFNVTFDNGWEYDRQIVKTEDWENRTKEFIVTSKELSKGEIKRTFKAVDSEKDWIAIKSKTEQTIENSGMTVGEYIYKTLLQNPSQKIRGKLVKTIERKFYKMELKKILSKQIELQPELFTKENYEACIQELYKTNESHRDNIIQRDFLYLFLEDIIFYQRPLKSQKGSTAGCTLEYRCKHERNSDSGALEKIKIPYKAISKSHPLFEEFRIWQWLQNLKIYNKENTEIDVTKRFLPNEAAWVGLFDFLNTKKELEQKQFIDYFIKLKVIDKAEKEHFRWNYPEDKKYPFAETRTQFISRLSKVEGLENPETFLDEKTQLGRDEKGHSISRIEQLWHIIYSVTDIKQYELALEKFALKHNIDKESFLNVFIKFPPFKSDFGSYSYKAIHKLLPLMRMGKYCDEHAVPAVVKDRAINIMQRVNQLNLNDDYTKKDLEEALQKVSDDDIPKQLIKSFVPLKDKNPLTGLNTYQATYLVYNRFAEVEEIQKWRSPEDIDKYLNNFKQHSLRNPIVEQVVTETLRVVKDIWLYYGNGAPDFFNEIHVELGREMKNPAGKREQLSKQNTENENTNHRIKEILKELMNDANINGDVRSFSPSHQDLLKIYEEGVFQNPEADYSKVSEDEIAKIRKNNTPSKNDIQRYKLWLEQGYLSPYTGKIIQISDLFTSKYDVEHIIPQSRYFDNSLSNKVICESEVNGDKSNKTAIEYLKKKGGSVVNGHKLFTLEAYEAHVSKYFKKNKNKLKNLLSEDIPEGFINRQLNDSRFISKLVKGLLSNIVREEGEQEATSKNLIPVTGVVTSKLKQDWGLNDKWNEIIAPRFKRLNELTQSNDFGFWDNDINAFRIQVPDEIAKGFDKKRIDHRHHALDALIVACTTRNHTQFLSSKENNYSLREKLLIKNKQGKYTKAFQQPWERFTTDAKNELEKTLISFKQNLRVINKATNKFWSYTDEDGKPNLGEDGKAKKRLRKQTKGDHWAVRKAMHKETVSGIYAIDTPKGKVATAVRTSLTAVQNAKHLEKITDSNIREVILPNHLKKYLDEKGEPDFAAAFSLEGIEDLNKNIRVLNNGKNHQPIYKVKQFEVGSKFPISENELSANNKKYVEAAKGTNLFFAIYWDEKKQKRNYETIPLNEVIAHQKQVAHLPKNQRLPIQPNSKLGEFLFTLSPNDLVYVPNVENIENKKDYDYNICEIKSSSIYKIVSFTGSRLYAIPLFVAKPIANKMEYTQLNKLEFTNEKEYCIKLKANRLGNISKA